MLQGFSSAITISVFGTSNMAGFAAAQKRLDKFAGNFEQASERVKKAGMKTALVGLGLAASLAMPILQMGKFETQVARVGGIAEASAAQVQAIGDTALYLGAKSSFTAQQIAEGQGELASMGLTADQVSLKTGIMADTIAFATGQQVAMADAGALLVGTLNAYQKPLSGATQLSDQFTAAMNKTNLKFTDMQEAMVNTASTSASFGQSVETNLALLGVLANRNETGARAGTRLAMTMTKLYTQAGKVNKALGVDVYDKATGKTRDFIEVFGEIQTRMKSMSEEAKNTTLTEIFGAEGIKVFNILMSSSREELMKLRGQISASAGATKEFEDRILDTPTGHWLLMKSAIDGVSMTIGKHLMPMVLGLVDGIRWVADAVFEWMRANPVITRIAASIALVSAVGLILGGVLLFVGGGMLHLAGMAMQLPAKLGQIAFSMGVTHSAAVPLVASLKAMGLAVLKLVWPFALVGLAVYGLTKAWQTNFLGFRDTVEEVWFAIKPVALAIAGAFQAMGKWIAGAFDSTIGALWRFTTAWYKGAMKGISPLLKFAGAVAWGMGYIVGILIRAWNGMKANPIVSGLLFVSLAAFTWPLILSALSAVKLFATQTLLGGAKAAGGFLLTRVAAMRTALAMAWAGRSALLLRVMTYSLVAATKLQAWAMGLLNAVMKANPIGIVIGLIAALAAGVVYAYKNFAWFKTFVDTMWDKYLGYLNLVIAALNLLIKTINLIPGIEIPTIPSITRNKDRSLAAASAKPAQGTGLGMEAALAGAEPGTRLTAAYTGGLASATGAVPGLARATANQPGTAVGAGNTTVSRSVSVAKIEVVSGPNTPAKSVRQQVVDALREAAGEEDGIDGVSYGY